jgi:SET family sugar efflux transporter-like MFS transporter
VLAGVASGFVAATWGYRAVFVFCVLLASTASIVLFIFNYQRGAKIFSDPTLAPVVQGSAVTTVVAGGERSETAL